MGLLLRPHQAWSGVLFWGGASLHPQAKGHTRVASHAHRHNPRRCSNSEGAVGRRAAGGVRVRSSEAAPCVFPPHKDGRVREGGQGMGLWVRHGRGMPGRARHPWDEERVHRPCRPLPRCHPPSARLTRSHRGGALLGGVRWMGGGAAARTSAHATGESAAAGADIAAARREGGRRRRRAGEAVRRHAGVSSC